MNELSKSQRGILHEIVEDYEVSGAELSALASYVGHYFSDPNAEETDTRQLTRETLLQLEGMGLIKFVCQEFREVASDRRELVTEQDVLPEAMVKELASSAIWEHRADLQRFLFIPTEKGIGVMENLA